MMTMMIMIQALGNYCYNLDRDDDDDDDDGDQDDDEYFCVIRVLASARGQPGL